ADPAGPGRSAADDAGVQGHPVRVPVPDTAGFHLFRPGDWYALRAILAARSEHQHLAQDRAVRAGAYAAGGRRSCGPGRAAERRAPAAVPSRAAAARALGGGTGKADRTGHARCDNCRAAATTGTTHDPSPADSPYRRRTDQRDTLLPAAPQTRQGTLSKE